MTSLLATLAILWAPAQAPDWWEMPSLDGTYPRFGVAPPQGKLSQTKVSPKHEWGFDYLTAGYASRAKEPLEWELRFRVYSQENRGKADISLLVTRTLLRLWEYNYDRLRLDHARAYRQLVDVYLSSQGKAGGEQLFAADPFEAGPDGRIPKANIIFIFDLPSFTNSLEQIREIAHEYGHASLPPMGIFTQPEQWINGDLGERIYLRYFLREIRRKRVTRFDVINASEESLAGYVAKNVTPLVQTFLKNGPDPKLAAKTDLSGANAYLGMMLHLETILPPETFGRVMVLSGDRGPSALKAVTLAVDEKATLKLNLGGMKGQRVWIPVGNHKVVGATVAKRMGTWSQVVPAGDTVTLQR